MMRSRFFTLLAVLVFLFPLVTFAQQNAAGIGISPAVIEQKGEPGQVINETIRVKNLSGSAQKYYIFTRDIVGVEGNGTPVFAEDGQEKTGYEMSEWIGLGVTEVDLQSEEEKPVDVTIAVPAFATPGSHFAGIFISMDPPKLRSTGASVAYQVANIVSIRVAGDVVENAEIRQFSTGDYIYGKSLVDFEARIENKGSTLIRPIGPLEITNMFGKRVAMLTFNDSKGAIFPGATRNFDITWEDEGPGFGRYEALVSLVYGEPGQQSTISSTVSFWILPANIMLPGIGILLFLLLVSYIYVKLYIRRRLQTAQLGGSRRIVRRRRSTGMSATLIVLVVMLGVTAIFLIILLALFA